MCLFVHMTNTTSQDGRARRKHTHSTKCSQCGIVLTKQNRVAAHVVIYPLGLPCIGGVTLKSTCKSCNHPHSRHRPSFWGGPRNIRILRFKLGRIRRRK